MRSWDWGTDYEANSSGFRMLQGNPWFASMLHREATEEPKQPRPSSGPRAWLACRPKYSWRRMDRWERPSWYIRAFGNLPSLCCDYVVSIV